MIFAWWMACLADAYRSVYYRRKPMLYVLPGRYVEFTSESSDRDDDDYDIDFYTVGPVPPDHLESQATQPSPREQLEVSTPIEVVFVWDVPLTARAPPCADSSS